MKKNVLAASLITLAMCFTFGLSACNNENEEDVPFVDEPDLYAMKGTDSIGEKIVDLALDGVKAGAKKGGKKVVTDFATWALKGIAKELGFEFAKEPNYKKIVSERLESIDSTLKNLEGKIDWLTESFSDQQYLNSYKAFMSEYERMNVVVKDLWRNYTTIEEEIADPDSTFTVEQKEELLDQLCADIRNNNKGLSALDVKASEFATNWIGYTTSTSSLSKYSIIYIIERFINKGSPFEENRYTNFNEVISDPLTVLYQASNLSVLEYTRQLTKGGVSEIRLGHDNFMIAYTAKVDNSMVSYINCKEADKDAFLETYKDDLGEEYDIYKALPCKTLVHYKTELNQLDFRIRDIMTKYDNVAILIHEFLENRYGDISDTYNQLYYEDGSIQKTNKVVRSVKNRHVLRFVRGAGRIAVMYENFGNIHKDEFLKYAKALNSSSIVLDENGYEKHLTFRELYDKEGYIFPENNESSLLVLGAEQNTEIQPIVGDPYYGNFINLVCLDLNTKVVDFNKNPTFKKFIFGVRMETEVRGSGCKTERVQDNNWFEAENGTRDAILRAHKDWHAEMVTGPTCRRIYYTIDGLSLHPETKNPLAPNFHF